MDNKRPRRSTVGSDRINALSIRPVTPHKRLSEPRRVAPSGSGPLISIGTPVRQSIRISTPGSSARRRRRRTSIRLSRPRTPIGRKSLDDMRKNSLGRRLSWVIDPNAQTKRYSAGGDLKMLARLMYKEKEAERARRRSSPSEEANPKSSSSQRTNDIKTPTRPSRNTTGSPLLNNDGSARRAKPSSRLSLSGSIPDDIMENIAIPEGVIREEGDFSTRFEDESLDIDGLSTHDMFDDMGMDGDAEYDDYADDHDRVEDDDEEDEDDPNLSLVIGARQAKALKSGLFPNRKRRVTFGNNVKGSGATGPTVVPVPPSLIRQSIDLLLPKAMRKSLSEEAFETIIHLTRQFTKQQAQDLVAYTEHRRKSKSVTINDALLLMKRAKVEFDDDLLNFSLGNFLGEDYLVGDFDEENANEDSDDSDTESGTPSESFESKIFSMAQHVYDMEEIIKVESILNIPKMQKRRIQKIHDDNEDEEQLEEEYSGDDDSIEIGDGDEAAEEEEEEDDDDHEEYTGDYGRHSHQQYSSADELGEYGDI